MSEATLRQFLARLNEDASYRESVQADPESAFAALGLNPAEKAALTSGDEDALRRLAGTDVDGFLNNPFPGLIPGFYRRANTPGSGQGCGTGSGGCPTYDETCD